MRKKPEDAAKPMLDTCLEARFSLGGEMGRRLDAVTRQWILPAPYANPGMLEMFRQRDRKPSHDMVPWAGEFAGKYLTHAVQVWRLTRDAGLGKHIRRFVAELVSLQADDGYLGPWPKDFRLRKGAPNCQRFNPQVEPWDAWGHYHVLMGLLLWYQGTGDTEALDCARRIGDLFCRRFLDNPKERLHDTGEHEMNQAPVHALAWLYRLTGEHRYLRMAEQIVAEFAIPPAGDYLNAALAGKEFWETPKPRWESLHPIMGLNELYLATGKDDYRRAFMHLWWSMLRGDRHNTGGFSSGEKATGNPYDEGAIETCCTVAWMAMSVEMLRLAGSSIVADELELSMFNSGLGMMSPSGRWVTYNTPMAGERQASAHAIVFQSRAGTPELNCCSVNGPRAIGLLCEWAVMRRSDGLVLNYYGPGTIKTSHAVLTQTTNYPREGRVDIAVAPRSNQPFTLALRIPCWSEKTRVLLNGKPLEGVKAGSYCEITRPWSKGDTLRMDFDFRPHFWVRETDAEESVPVPGVRRASVYRGPLLLAYDPHHQSADSAGLPVLDGAALKLRRGTDPRWLQPWLLLETTATDGSKVHLCDFASAGMAGTAYETWLRVANLPAPVPFAKENPLRSQRAWNDRKRRSER
ncbi:MAG: beta-L-arabinofuranosidase domain-containing protein [Kiritimatiellia bacterium]